MRTGECVPAASGVRNFFAARFAADVLHRHLLTAHGSADGHLALAAMLGQDNFLDNMGLLGNDRLLAGFGHFDRPLLERLLEFLRLQSPIDTVALRLDALLKKSDP